MHSGKKNVDTRAAHIPASICYGLPLPGTGAGAPILHTPLMFPFWPHNLFPSQEIFQCKGVPGCSSLGQKRSQQLFWEPAASPPCSAAAILLGWRTDPSQSYPPAGDLFRAPTVSCAVLVIILTVFIVICLIIRNLYLISLIFFFRSFLFFPPMALFFSFHLWACAH